MDSCVRQAIRKVGPMSERHATIKHRTQDGRVVDKLIFDLSGLSSEEAARMVWQEFVKMGWVKDQSHLARS